MLVYVTLGLYPGLFTSSELLVMSSKMQAGRLKKTVEGAQQVFARAVCRQLHVFILWDVADGKSGSLFSQSMASQPSLESGLLSEESSRLCFSSLYRACSYVDYYQPWSKQDYCDIALRWWQRFNGGRYLLLHSNLMFTSMQTRTSVSILSDTFYVGGSGFAQFYHQI